MEFLLEGFADSLDALQIVLPGPLNDIAVKRSHDLGTIAVGSDFEGVLSFQFEKEGNLFEDFGKMVASNFWHDGGASSDRSVPGSGGDGSAGRDV